MQPIPEVILYFVGGVLDGDALFSNVHVTAEEREKALRYYAESQHGTEGRRFTVGTGSTSEIYEVIRRSTVGNVVFVRSSSIAEPSPADADCDFRARCRGLVRHAKIRKRRVLDRDEAMLCADIMSFRLDPLRTPPIAESSRGE